MNENVEKKKRKAFIALTELQLEAVKAGDTFAHGLASRAIVELTAADDKDSPG